MKTKRNYSIWVGDIEPSNLQNVMNLLEVDLTKDELKDIVIARLDKQIMGMKINVNGNLRLYSNDIVQIMLQRTIDSTNWKFKLNETHPKYQSIATMLGLYGMKNTRRMIFDKYFEYE